MKRGMGRKRFTAEQIINMLGEAEVLLKQDSTVGEVCRKLGISEQIYYRWRMTKAKKRNTMRDFLIRVPLNFI